MSSVKVRRDHWMAEKILDEPTTGFFYQLEYSCLDSFSAFEIVYQGKNYATAEHLYEAFKFMHMAPSISEDIRKAKSPYEAKMIAHLPENIREIRPDWEDVKEKKMRTVCLLKMQQHRYVRDKLQESGICPLAELSPSDLYWGIGDGNGLNMLGNIWAEFRELGSGCFHENVIEDLWQSIIDIVSEECELSEISKRTWLVPLKLSHIDRDNNRIIIDTNGDELSWEYVKKKYTLAFKITIHSITGLNYQITFTRRREGYNG